MNPKVILCIRCAYGHHLTVALDRATADAFVRQWAEGKLPTSPEGLIVASAPPLVPIFAVRAKDIVMMHTQEIEAGQLPGYNAPQWAGAGPRGSGI